VSDTPASGIEPLFNRPDDDEIATALAVLEWLDQSWNGRLIRAVIEVLSDA
jgi:hypothetical protein